MPFQHVSICRQILLAPIFILPAATLEARVSWVLIAQEIFRVLCDLKIYGCWVACWPVGVEVLDHDPQCPIWLGTCWVSFSIFLSDHAFSSFSWGGKIHNVKDISNCVNYLHYFSVPSLFPYCQPSTSQHEMWQWGPSLGCSCCYERKIQ